MDTVQFNSLMNYIEKQETYHKKEIELLDKINAKMAWFVFLSILGILGAIFL